MTLSKTILKIYRRKTEMLREMKQEIIPRLATYLNELKLRLFADHFDRDLRRWL